MKMYRNIFLFVSLLALSLSCEKPLPPQPDPEPVLPTEEVAAVPTAPDADKACTLYFNPRANSAFSSSLYNYSGDIYVHIGIFYNEEWQFVQSQWNENIAKCRMTRLGDNSYKLELNPSIREYFGSGTTPVEKIAIVFRSADGSRQTKPDYFVDVTDKTYQTKPFTPDPVIKEAMPQGVKEGINYNNDNSVTLVLYDKSKTGKSYDYSYVIGEFSNWEREKNYMMKRDDNSGCWWYTFSGLNPDKEYMFQYYLGNSETSLRIHDPYTEVVYDPWNDQYISSSTYPDLPAYPSQTKDRVSAFRINKPVYNWEIPDFKLENRESMVIYELLLRDFTESHDLNGAMAKLDYLKSLGVNAVELMPIQEFEGNESWGYNPCSYFALDKAYGTPQMYKEFVDECHKRGMAVIVDVVYNHATGAHPFARLWWDAAKSNVSAENPYFNVNTPHGFGVFHDFNHKEPKLVEHVNRSLTYLLEEYKVDGFRFDLTKGFTNNAGKDSAYDQDRVNILKAYNTHIKSVKDDAIVILEHFVDQENAALAVDGMFMWGNNNYAYSAVMKGNSADLSYMYDGACARVGFMESHDEERITIGASANSLMDRASLAAVFMLGVPGPKMIWQFGELAYDFSINHNGDRTAAKPVRWDYLDNEKRKGVHDTYASMLALRNAHPELFGKNCRFTQTVGNGNSLKILHSESEGKHMLVLGNFGASSAAYSQSLPADCTWHDYFAGTSFSGKTYESTVPAGKFVVLTNFE